MKSNKPNITHLGRYQIIQQIGDGAMAVVYSALDPMLNRTVAIKVIREELSVNDEYIARFQREAESAAKLSHPSIVTVYDVGVVEHRPYIVMELLQGRTMQEIIDSRRTFATKETLDIGIDLASALSYAHNHHMVHRDIKPANIICTDSDGKYTAKITDFGIVRLTNEGMTEFTTAGSLIGSPSNMSPEQVKGLPVDGRSDLFSLGITLYQMLTGTRPFGGEGHTMLYAIAELPHRPITELLPNINPNLVIVVNKLLEKDPKHRYLSGKTLADDLQIIKSDLFGDPKNELPAKRNVTDTAIVDKGSSVTSKGLYYEEKRAPQKKDRSLPFYTLGLFLFASILVLVTITLCFNPLVLMLNQRTIDKSGMLADLIAKQNAENIVLQNYLIVDINVRALAKEYNSIRTLTILDGQGVIRGDIADENINHQVDVKTLPNDKNISQEASNRPLDFFGISLPARIQELLNINQYFVVSMPIKYTKKIVGYIRFSLSDSITTSVKTLLSIALLVGGIYSLLAAGLFYFYVRSFLRKKTG